MATEPKTPSTSARRNAMERSGIKGAAFSVYGTLLMIQKLPPGRRPKTLKQLAERCGVSGATLTRALEHLNRHGWVTRERGGGKNNPTRIEPIRGAPCDCRPDRKKPMTNAEKCRAYRRRKRTATPGNEPQPTPANGAQSDPGDTSKLRCRFVRFPR